MFWGHSKQHEFLILSMMWQLELQFSMFFIWGHCSPTLISDQVGCRQGRGIFVDGLVGDEQ